MSDSFTPATPQRGEAGYVPDPFLTAISHQADGIRLDLYRVIQRNPGLEPGLLGRLVTIMGKAQALANVEHLEMLEHAWRGHRPSS
jgi:hypothetical protein